MKIELARDILDQELVDRNGTKMGRVDGLVIIVEDGEPPRIDRMELGWVVLARRLSPRLERLVERFRARWSVRKVARYGIPWASIAEITPNHIKVNIDAMNTPAFDWERWFRDYVISKIPGSGDKG